MFSRKYMLYYSNLRSLLATLRYKNPVTKKLELIGVNGSERTQREKTRLYSLHWLFHAIFKKLQC